MFDPITAADWKETAQKFADDYHAELERRIDAEQGRKDDRAAIEEVVEEWEFSQGDLGNDTFPIRDAARAIRAALPPLQEES